MPRAHVCLSRNLQQNSSIKTLTLNSCTIADEGCKAIAEVLKRNTTITELELNNNMIDYEGCAALAEALAANTALRVRSSPKRILEAQEYVLDVMFCWYRHLWHHGVALKWVKALFPWAHAWGSAKEEGVCKEEGTPRTDADLCYVPLFWQYQWICALMSRSDDILD